MPTVDSIMLEARAASFTRRSIKRESKCAGLRLAVRMVDLTTLEGKDSPEKVRGLCRKAQQPSELPFGVPIPPVAAVCVYPALVSVAKDALRESSVKVASVATAFPSGQLPLKTRVAEVAAAVEAGADEVDMVISRGAFLSGQLDRVREEIQETRRACGSAHLKIILETGELETYDQIRRASDLAIDSAAATPGLHAPSDGEIFIKTSTGKVSPAATLPVTLVMLEAIRDHARATGLRIGMKPAGGIRTAKSALHYLVMVKETLGEPWLSPHLFRFGASTLLNDLIRQLARAEFGRYAAGYDVSEA